MILVIENSIYLLPETSTPWYNERENKNKHAAHHTFFGLSQQRQLPSLIDRIKSSNRALLSATKCDSFAVATLFQGYKF